MRPSWKWMAAAVAILAAPIASAHEFTCEKTVNGEDVVHVSTYPATVTYEWTITNALPSTPSTTNKIEDTLFQELPFTLPLTLQGGASTSATDTLEITSYAECARLAGIENPTGAITLTNTLTVWFDTTSTTCDAQVICHPLGEGACLTRTPGYWGTHPNVTAKFLPLESCGEDLTVTAAGAAGSITEDLCSVGTDHKVYGSPQEAQLVRQCAAAALNIAASAFFDATCTEGSTVFARCCSACGGSGADIAASGCIEDLDRFNNSTDTLLDEGEEISLCHALELPCAAQPQACQTAKGNGVVNDRTQTASTISAVDAGAAAGPTSGGCSGGPGGAFALLGTLGLLALHRRR